MAKPGWKPKVLWTDNPQRVGNAILYGKELSKYRPEIMLNLVETDFGNRMRLTDNELDELYTIGPEKDYDVWKLDRDALRIENMLKDLESYDQESTT